MRNIPLGPHDDESIRALDNPLIELAWHALKEIALRDCETRYEAALVLSNRLDTQVKKMIKEEREACAEIADRQATIYAKGASPEDIHGYPHEFREISNSAKRIAQEIRARSS